MEKAKKGAVRKDNSKKGQSTDRHGKSGQRCRGRVGAHALLPNTGFKKRIRTQGGEVTMGGGVKVADTEVQGTPG